MRCLLDCKYNEYLVSESCLLHTHFPEFVNVWLRTFSIDVEKRTVRTLNLKEKAKSDELYCTFLLDLLNPKLKRK